MIYTINKLIFDIFEWAIVIEINILIKWDLIFTLRQFKLKPYPLFIGNFCYCVQFFYVREYFVYIGTGKFLF
jgi:hypothetical protein